MKNVFTVLIVALSMFGVDGALAKPTTKPQPYYSKGDGSIKPTGKEAKYPVFGQIDADDLDAFKWNINSEMFTPEDLRIALPSIHPQDVNANGYTCEFLCVNAKGQVVGWNPLRR